jgi:hypothetical protein
MLRLRLLTLTAVAVALISPATVTSQETDVATVALDPVVAVAKDLKDLACEMHCKVKGKIPQESITILVARVKVDGKPEIVITTNTGSGGDRACLSAKKIKAKCKELLKAKNPKTPEEEEEENDDKYNERICKLLKTKAGKASIEEEKKAWIMTQVDGTSGGWYPPLKKCFGEWGKKYTVIEDLSKHKYDPCTGKKWPHAENTLKCWMEKKKAEEGVTKVELCDLGICRGDRGGDGDNKTIPPKVDMCWRCYCDYGPNGEKWPKPQCVTDKMIEATECEIKVKKEGIKKPKKPKTKISDVSRDGGANFEDCTGFESIAFTFDVPVEFDEGAISVFDPSGQLVPVETYLVEDSVVAADLMSDAVPGEYTVVLDPEKVRSVFLQCEVDLQEPTAMSQVVAIDGDIDLDMQVGMTDVVEFVGYMIAQPIQPQWAEGDFNDDDNVNWADAFALIRNYGTSY